MLKYYPGNSFSLLILSCLFFVAGMQQKPATADQIWLEDLGYTVTSPTGTLTEHPFKRGRNLVFKQEYSRALPYLNTVRSETSSVKLFNVASLLRAQALYHLGDYIEAYEAFKELGQRMGTRYRNLIVRYKMDIGFQLMKGKDHRTFLGLFPILSAEWAGERIVRTNLSRYPYKPFSDTFQYRLANLYFQRGRYEVAAEEYKFLLKQYEQSSWLPHAQFLAAESYFRTFDGLAYDISNLTKARDHYRTYIQRYPGEPKVNLAKQRLRKIVTKKAEKQFNTADYYERTGHRSGAITYYNSVVNSYPGTKWGERALDRLKYLDADVNEESQNLVKSVKKPRILDQRPRE